MLALYARDQRFGGLVPQHVLRLNDRREPRREDIVPDKVVITDDGDVPGTRELLLLDRSQQADGHHAVGDEDGCRFLAKQRQSSGITGLDSIVAICNQLRVQCYAMSLQRCLIAVEASPRGAGARASTDDADPLVA